VLDVLVPQVSLLARNTKTLARNHKTDLQICANYPLG